MTSPPARITISSAPAAPCLPLAEGGLRTARARGEWGAGVAEAVLRASGQQLLEAIGVVERADDCEPQGVVGDEVLGDALYVLRSDRAQPREHLAGYRGACSRAPRAAGRTC